MDDADENDCAGGQFLSRPGVIVSEDGRGP